MIKACSTRLSSNSPSASASLYCSLWERCILLVISSKKPKTHRRHLFARSLFLLVVICFFLFFAGSVSAFTLAPLQITVDTVWQKDAGPFVISSDLTIDNGVTLTIESGTTIAVSNNPFIIVDGSLVIGSQNSQKTIIDSTIDLVDEYSEFWDFAFDGTLSFLISGRADIFNTDILIPTFFNLKNGNVRIFNTHTTQDEMVFTNQSNAEIYNSIFDSVSSIMLQDASFLSIKNSHIIGGSSSGSLFNIFEESQINFEKSEIEPMFSDFALLLDGSSLFATSTKISGMNSYGIQASRGSRVSLFDVQMDTIFSPESSSAFLMLVGSSAIVTNSTFSNSENNAIELYQSNGIYSDLSLKDSIIENFGNAGISAVQANLSVDNSLIWHGVMGIENIFSSTTISNSNISENSQYGITAYIPAFIVHAENNFWGDPSGPYHQTLNTGGAGNVVSDNVLFNPWLSADPRTVCCSSVLFLPGLEASRLYKNTDRLWEPGIGSATSKLFMDEKGQSIYPDIYTRDVIDEALIPIIGPNIYKSFIVMMDDLRKEGTITDWEPIPYDWRLSLDQILDSGKKIGDNLSYLEATSSPYIVQELERLAETSKTGKVTIIAHSNGGLLAKALMTRLSEIGSADLVDKIIFVAVPQTGTPQAIGVLLHGYDAGIPLLLSAKTAMELGLNMPSAYNLIPSASYFDSVSDPVIKFRKTGINIASSTILYNFLAEKKLNPLLLGSAKITHDTLDAWLPPPDIELVQIAGWGIDTVSGIEYYQGIKWGKPITQYKPIIVVDGDNTVVVPSALATATSTPNIERYWLDLDSYNKASFFGRKHNNILEVESLRDFLKNIIKKENQTPPTYISTTTPISTANNKRLHFILHSSSLGLNLYDGGGNHTGISTTTGHLEEGIPDVYYQEFGQVKYISLPVSLSAEYHSSESNLRIVISKNDDGYTPDSFTLEVEETIGNNISTTTSFVDILAEEKIFAVVDVPQSISELLSLKVDENNDGVMDFEVKPGEIFLSVPTILEEQKIINNEVNNSMKIENFVSNKQYGQNRHLDNDSFNITAVRKTSIRDIQELIDSIKLPDLISPAVDKKIEDINTNVQTATVFNSGQNIRNFFRSIVLIIIAILKAIWVWILKLFNI